jgi:hypothetical protein
MYREIGFFSTNEKQRETLDWFERYAERNVEEGIASVIVERDEFGLYATITRTAEWDDESYSLVVDHDGSTTSL